MQRGSAALKNGNAYKIKPYAMKPYYSSQLAPCKENL